MTRGGDTIFTRDNAQLIEQQQVPNPMAKGTFFTNMTELLWSDNTTTFGCLICGDQMDSRPQLSIHVGKAHNPAKPKKPIKKATRKYTKRNTEYWANGGNINQNRPTTDQTLTDRELAFWKAQAHKAEAENRKLRAQLKALLNIK